MAKTTPKPRAKRPSAPAKKTTTKKSTVRPVRKRAVVAKKSKSISQKRLLIAVAVAVAAGLVILSVAQTKIASNLLGRDDKIASQNCIGALDNAPVRCTDAVSCVESTQDDCYSETPATLGATTTDFSWPILRANWPAVTNPIVNCDLIYSDRTISTGIEIAVPTHTKVYAAATGTVKVAEMRNGYGVLVIDTGIPSSAGGGKTVRLNYNYLLDLVDTIKPGVTVQKGQYLAVTGNTPASAALQGKAGFHFGIWRTIDADGVVAGHVPYYSSSTATTMSEQAKALIAKIYHPMNFLPLDGRVIRDCDTTKQPGEFNLPGTGTNVLKPGTGTTTPPAPTPTPTIYKVYMNPAGSDANNGLSTSKPVKTLARVHQILQTAKPQTNVEIRIKKGTYLGQTVTWRYFVPNRTISFMPEDYNYGENINDIAGRPVFDGQSKQWMMEARSNAGINTNLRFYYLEVKKYGKGGIMVHGGFHTVNNLRRAFSSGANANTFYGLYMHHMGSLYTPYAAYGALDLVNSRNNKILNNRFEYLENRNTNGDQARVHAIYFAHQSNNNVVANNTFRKVSGDPIRVRNDSNNNEVRNNVFRATAVATAFGDWFEDNASPKECASHGNTFHHNDLGSNYLGRTLVPTKSITGGSSYDGSHPDCSNNGQPRFRSWSNT